MHHHTWTNTTTPNDNHHTYQCTNCAETTNGCNTCGDPLETTMLTCTHCITKARLNLTNLKTQLTQIPQPTLGLQAIRYDKPRIHNGTDDARLPHRLDQTCDDPDQQGLTGIRTAQGIHTIILNWAEDWADHRQETFAGDPFTYLHTMTIWAAQTHPAWTDYRKEMRTLLGKATHLAGNKPERHAVPCIHCAGTIIRQWTEDGLDDEATCKRCKRSWTNPEQLDRENQQTLHDLPNTHPNTEVTRDDIRRIHPCLNRNTLRSWIARGDIKPTGTNNHGELTYTLSHITQRMEGCNA